MILYNLFSVAGRAVQSLGRTLHARGGDGFDWVYVNPIQQLGNSRSLYSIADYFSSTLALLDPASAVLPEAQCREMIGQARAAGLKVMIDLVINHCAYDSRSHANTGVVRART